MKLAWARTGAFSSSEISQKNALLAEEDLKDIVDKAERGESKEEKRYVAGAAATIDSSLRNLDIIYKGRENNFEQNARLRSAYLKTIEENIEFGNRAKDFLKSLPAIFLGSATGVVLFESMGIDLDESVMALIALAFAGAGYLVNLAVVRLTRKKKQMLLMMEDYERTLYFKQYVNRACLILRSLYIDLDRLHRNIFEEVCPETRSVDEIIDELMDGLRPTFCKFVHKHMIDGKITPDLWMRCETGEIGSIETCPHWEK